MPDMNHNEKIHNHKQKTHTQHFESRILWYVFSHEHEGKSTNVSRQTRAR